MNATIEQVRYFWFLLLTCGFQWVFLRTWVSKMAARQRASLAVETLPRKVNSNRRPGQGHAVPSYPAGMNFMS